MTNSNKSVFSINFGLKSVSNRFLSKKNDNPPRFPLDIYQWRYWINFYSFTFKCLCCRIGINMKNFIQEIKLSAELL